MWSDGEVWGIIARVRVRIVMVMILGVVIAAVVIVN